MISILTTATQVLFDPHPRDSLGHVCRGLGPLPTIVLVVMNDGFSSVRDISFRLHLVGRCFDIVRSSLGFGELIPNFNVLPIGMGIESLKTSVLAHRPLKRSGNAVFRVKSLF